MKKFTMFAALAMVMVFALSSFASDLPKFTEGNSTLHGGSANFAKALGDTIDLMGPASSGAAYVGDFTSGWNGWTSFDITQPTVTHWQVSTFQAVSGLQSAWCGSITFASCNDSLDVDGGYGNSWHDILSYSTVVADPAASATVNVVANLNYDTEGGYDYTRLSAKIEGQLGFTDIVSWTGTGSVAVNENITYLPTELVDGNMVQLVFRVQSDGGWSDADCSFYGAGACQLDDVVMTTTQTGQVDIVDSDDFEAGFGNWTPIFPDGVGDFAALWNNLEDNDPCATNYSQQVAFIDDGVVVPGTGGSDCINWCYGPSGYIVNTTGGLAGPASHIQVDLESPVMTWPNNTYDGIRFQFDAYRHEDLSSDAPGIFYTWGIRSADTDDSAGNGAQILDEQTYFDRNFVYYGGPDYIRAGEEVTDLMNPGRDVVQLRIGIYELGWAWGWIGNDGYPAPYFDNVSVKVFAYNGPGMSGRELDFAQDNFPEADAIDTNNLGGMHVRFDMANNISLAAALRNDPGDSMVLDVVPVRAGAVLAGAPEFHYTIDANPLFNAFRTTPTSGMVLGVPAVGVAGPVPDKFAFDLPDTGTLFPGDVLHYYIRAGDQVGVDVQYSTMPANITNFGDFSGPNSYNSTYTIHALPTISADGFGGFTQPKVLFWNDFANRGGENEWYGAFNNIGLTFGSDYDIYYTNGPSSGVGNGIGGRTSGLALAGYEDMVYTAGNLGVNTISNGDFNNDAGDDINALNNWFADGSKDMFLTGDDLASDLGVNAGANGIAFMENVMGVDIQTNNVRAFIDNQATPLVKIEAGNPVFQNVSQWIAYGGCFGINTFDGVTPRAGAQMLARFTDTTGAPAYSYSAATLNIVNPGVNQNRIVSMPYDLMYIYTSGNGAKVDAPLAARVKVLQDVLAYFGIAGDINAVVGTDLPDNAQFSVRNYPNPFNPQTKISYTLKSPGYLTMKVFNVRGQLVKTLIDGKVASRTGSVVWDGTNNQGSSVSSGVYFYETRSGSDVQVNKMALVK